VSMMRFGKQMQSLAPKQQKIKERYKDDRQRMNQELAKLMREEQINPFGMLGCLPMFLQMPIWVALYATIYFAFDLRHEPAFFGLFQNFGGWTFLNDLSSPDHFIDFGAPVFTVPLMGAISGFNILPILMGAIFFVQQKYMSPPSTGNLSPEQEQTQKLMKIMIVVMFPIFMYNAPSGLTLYILTSSTLGVIESRYIRKHVDAMDLEAPAKKKPAKGGGGGVRKAVENTAYGRGPEQRNRYKNRKK
ncbi:MAG: YidC/Oxa1 family membrane protein insertase, partial [Planctomycetota bacterium]